MTEKFNEHYEGRENDKHNEQEIGVYGLTTHKTKFLIIILQTKNDQFDQQFLKLSKEDISESTNLRQGRLLIWYTFKFNSTHRPKLHF